MESLRVATAATVSGIQQQVVEEVLLRQQVRALRIAAANNRVLRRYPLWGSDLRRFVTVYKRPTSVVASSCRLWSEFTHPLSAMVPDFPSFCSRREDDAERFTALVARARPMHSIRIEGLSTEDDRVEALSREYTTM